MTTVFKLRRGTTTQHSTFTGAAGEATIDTTKNTIVVHDGATAGGIPLAKESAIISAVASLGFTPYNATNPAGYISGINSANVTTALGFTPYNATNPAGYTTNLGTVTAVTASAPLSSSGGTTPAISLAASGVAAGTTGSSTSIPVVTVDTYGRVTAMSSATVAGGQYYGSAATKAIAYNADTISENITIASGTNGLSAGPITISTGYTVTVNGNWVIV